MLIGVTGKKRRGKGEIAKHLSTKHRFNEHGFADKVKELLYAINPTVFVPTSITLVWETLDIDYPHVVAVVEEHDEIPGVELSTHGGLYWLRDVVDSLGWELAKEVPVVRELLQRTGTEGGRKLFGEDFWVDQLFRELEQTYLSYQNGISGKALQSNIVIADLRFDNEARKIKEFGGVVIQVDSERPGLPEADSHASENGISPDLIDGYLHNNGTIEELQNGVEEVLDFIGFAKK